MSLYQNETIYEEYDQIEKTIICSAGAVSPAAMYSHYRGGGDGHRCNDGGRGSDLPGGN